MTWELVEVTTEPAWVQDNSGVYTMIHRVVEKDVHKGIAGERVFVRVDLMSKTGTVPIRSWIGRPDAVRKAMMQYVDRISSQPAAHSWLSAEHASYIGAEITRAGLDPHYAQS